MRVLAYTNIREMAEGMFKGCDSLEYITIPSSVQQMTWYVFGGHDFTAPKSLREVVVEAGNMTYIAEGFDNDIQELVDYPATISSFGFGQPSTRPRHSIFRSKIPPETNSFGLSGKGIIYVPDDALAAYKSSVYWLRAADRIHPLSEYQP